jgi:hypothetical protein
MSKADKKKQRLIDQIALTEKEVLDTIAKKRHGQGTVDIQKLNERIKKLKAELAALK